MAAMAYHAFVYMPGLAPLARLDDPERLFVKAMLPLATGYLGAYLLTDIVYRSRTPWYGVPLVFLLTSAAAILAVSYTKEATISIVQTLLGGAITAAAGVGGGGGAGLLLLALALATAVLLGLAIGLPVSLVTRGAIGLPLWGRNANREVLAHLGGAAIWFAVALIGYLAVRSAFRGVRWESALVPLTLACVGALAAAAAHLYLVRRIRRDGQAGGGKLRTWIFVLGCLVAFPLRPELLGVHAWRFFHDVVHPGAASLNLVPRKTHAIGDYQVTSFYGDRRVAIIFNKRLEHLDGVSMPIPPGIPLREALDWRHDSRVRVLRRDAEYPRIKPWLQHREKFRDQARSVRSIDQRPELMLVEDYYGDFLLTHRDPIFPGIDVVIWLEKLPPDVTIAVRALDQFVAEHVKPAP